ncbi:zinc finger protein 37-like [Neodiprion lecontei]|uniref:Zinc finger protein 37-like n=1 Tax=Neodiprion lecontei TaxID=441921 RepID=A0A6J0B9P0_NEOLC|nr:zinc finger protein 37-like [Neodiprion lecontei]
MTNIHRPTIEIFPHMESSRDADEVHLTELLPVKQLSICRKNDDDKEDTVADAFKALRERNKHDFSIGRNEFCATGDDDEFDEGVNDVDDSLDEYNPKITDEINVDQCSDGKRNTLKRKSNRVFKKRMKFLKKNQLESQKKGKHEKNEIIKSNGLNNVLDRDELDGSDFCNKSTVSHVNSRLSPIAQDLDKNGTLPDEVYVFHQDKNGAEVINAKASESLKRKCSNSNSKIRLNGSTSNRTTGRNNKAKGEVTMKERSKINDESLREKIDAIIQANSVMEGNKNNNTSRENRNNKLQNEAHMHGLSDISESEIRHNSGEEESSLIKKHRCAICSARFKGSGGLRTHYKVVHAGGPMFTCNECGKEFPLKERLKLHVRTHTGYKPYKCTDCEKSFARGGQLVQHRRTHTQVKPYRCVLCPGTFSCAANLALHVKRHNGQKDHKCEICGRAFVRRDALKKHLECLHKDVKSFLCVICNKTFKGHLPQHMRTHAQDRPHGCGTCGQRFAQKSQLTVHQRTHSGQRPFRCLVCWQAFAHSTALKLHTRRHTGERPFKCAECSAGFTQLPHWKKHMRCVHGRTDPYCCKNCNTFFRIKNDLETHEKSCHVGETPAIDADPENRTGRPMVPKYRIMTVEKMRLLLAVLFKRISKPERLDELGFGKRLIDEVLKDSLISAGKEPAQGSDDANEFDILKQNLATFLEWTVPPEHWETFKKLNKTPEEILETLTVSQ